jgi:hypothetical protein
MRPWGCAPMWGVGRSFAVAISDPHSYQRDAEALARPSPGPRRAPRRTAPGRRRCARRYTSTGARGGGPLARRARARGARRLERRRPLGFVVRAGGAGAGEQRGVRPSRLCGGACARLGGAGAGARGQGPGGRGPGAVARGQGHALWEPGCLRRCACAPAECDCGGWRPLSGPPPSRPRRCRRIREPSLARAGRPPALSRPAQPRPAPARPPTWPRGPCRCSSAR